MATTKYLDYDGLLYFWSLIKAKLALKANAQSVTAGSYGPSADASPAHSGTFKVPYVQVTSQGVVTAISEKTITLPASGNTDTKVKQNLLATSQTGKYPLLTKYTTTANDNVANEANYVAAVTVQPSTGTVQATKFKGALEGNADSATKVGSSNVGDSSTPIYLASGVATACTNLDLNTTGNAATADKVNHKLTIKIDSTTTTEGTDYYEFDGSAAKTFDIKHGSNITFTKASGSLTIAGTPDTQNTAGSTAYTGNYNLYIVGAPSQAASHQTYSKSTAYIGTDGHLYSNSKKVFTSDDTYTKTEIDNKLASGVNYKGTVATQNDLPANPTVGDMYNVADTDFNYIWAGATGTQGQTGYVAPHWDPVGALVNIEAITNSQIDDVVAS